MLYKFAKFGFTMLLAAFLSSFLRPELGAAAGAVFLIGGAVFCAAFKKFGTVKLCCFAAAAGMILVSAHLARSYYPQKALDGITAEITGRVVDFSSGGGNHVFTIKTDSVSVDGAPQKITVKVSGWGENYAEIYDNVSCSVTFFTFAEEEISEALTNRSGGVALYSYLNSPLKVTGEYRKFPEYTIYSLREKLSSIVNKNFFGWRSGFTNELLFGNGEVDTEIKDSFRAAGMSHILAISGMHLVVIMGLLEKLLCCKNSEGILSTIKTVVLMAATVLYMALAGFGMSVMRAGFMLLASYFAQLLWAKSASIDNLGISIVAVLMIDPLACCDAGFLMSVLSSGGIVLFSKPLSAKLSAGIGEKHWTKFLRGAVRVFAVGFVAWAAALPVAVFAFGGASLIAPVSNIFAGIFSHGAIIFGFLCVLFGLMPLGSLPALACAAVSQVFENILLWIAEFFGSLPFAYIYTNEGWIKIWLVGACLLFALPLTRRENARYVKHAALMAAFAFLCGMLCHSFMYAGTVSTEIVALEHGTAIRLEKDGSTVIFAKGLTYDDKYKLKSGGKSADMFISLSSDTSPIELELAKEFSPEVTLLSDIDALHNYAGSIPVSAGEAKFWDGASVKIIPNGAVEIDTGDILVLYIFGECDIMDIEPRFRKAEIIILDGVSPGDYPALRCQYMLLHRKAGIFSGAEEVIILTEGEQTFISRGKNIEKGWAFT